MRMARQSGEEASSSTISGHGEAVLLGSRGGMSSCAVARIVRKTRQRIVDTQRKMGKIMQMAFVKSMVERTRHRAMRRYASYTMESEDSYLIILLHEIFFAGETTSNTTVHETKSSGWSGILIFPLFAMGTE